MPLAVAPHPSASPAKSRPSLRFRGRSYLALALAPEMPLDEWLVEIDAWIARSPAFFIGRAVVLDLTSSPMDKPGIRYLLEQLKARNIRVMAIEGVGQHALEATMPPAVGGGRPAGGLVEAGMVTLDAPRHSHAEAHADSHADAPATAAMPHEAPAAAQAHVQPQAPAPTLVSQPLTSEALILTEPVRSGQSVVHPQGDVIVLGSVASGAEVVAGGSIHIYGALRGRAIAGVAGQGKARIFCRKLHAELLAIDGLYKAADDLDARLFGAAVQIWLDDDAMKMAALD